MDENYDQYCENELRRMCVYRKIPGTLAANKGALVAALREQDRLWQESSDAVSAVLEQNWKLRQQLEKAEARIRSLEAELDILRAELMVEME